MNTEVCKQIVAEWLEEFDIPELVPKCIDPINLCALTNILAIVGPRRAGKTYFMYQLVQSLLAHSEFKKDDILFVDFEDYRLIDFSPDRFNELLAAFNQLTGKNPKFLFLDEVQHLRGWSRVLRTLHNRKRYKIVVSGSNSELLSQEVATELRGRYRDLLMLPFSFSEMLVLKGVKYSEKTFYTAGKGSLLKAFDEYLTTGGFPEVLNTATSTERRRLIQSYFRTIFYRDIIDRYNIKAKYLLEAVMDYCLNIYSDLFSVSRFEKHSKATGLTGSKRTISNYVKYLEEAFFVILNEKFSFSPPGGTSDRALF